jgi:hypothetical protein
MGLEVRVKLGKAILFSDNVQQAIGNCTTVKHSHRCLVLHAPQGEIIRGSGPDQG